MVYVLELLRAESSKLLNERVNFLKEMKKNLAGEIKMISSNPCSTLSCWTVHFILLLDTVLGGAVAHSIELATLGQEIPGRSPLWPPAPYWTGRCQYNVTGLDRSHGLPTLSRVSQLLKLSDVSLGTRLRYSLVVDEDVKKPNKQTYKDTVLTSLQQQRIFAPHKTSSLPCAGNLYKTKVSQNNACTR